LEWSGTFDVNSKLFGNAGVSILKKLEQISTRVDGLDQEVQYLKFFSQ
jgi:hypothetical protein